MKEISRRSALQALALTPAVISPDPKAHEHPMNAAQPKHKSAGPYNPKVFDAHQYATLCSLCNSIIPPDETSGGAVEAGAPELIDLLASENQDYETRLTGGLQWLDSTCQGRYEHSYAECSATQQKEILDLIAYRENAQNSPQLSSGIAFFRVPSRSHARRLFHQRNWHEEPTLPRQSIRRRIPRLPANPPKPV